MVKTQSQVFQQNNLLKLCIGSLVKSENCNRMASPPDLAHCAPPHSGNARKKTFFPVDVFPLVDYFTTYLYKHKEKNQSLLHDRERF